MATFDDRLGREKRFSFVSTSVSPDTFAVVELEGVEAISRPYEFALTLASERADLDLDELLARPATVTIHSRVPGQPSMPYHGVLTECAQLHQVANKLTLYRAVLVPRLQRLALHQHSEVYLNQTIPQCVETLLKHESFNQADYEFRLTKTDYAVRAYACQFEETPLAFMNRTMEWRGMYYFFEQEDGKEKLIITDSKTIHVVSRGPLSYRPAQQLDVGLVDEYVQSMVCIQKQVPRKVGIREYNYDKATLEMVGEAEVSSKGAGEVWLYGENWFTPDAEKLAGIRAEELSCRAKVFHGDGTATRLRAGYLMDLQGHYRQDFNMRYLITEVRHEGSQAGTLVAGLDTRNDTGVANRQDFYRTTFTAIPAALQFRPERATPKPKIHGLINAFVDAEGSGEYAEIDEHGRYKVQVPFDKTDKAAGKGSAWVRKASQYSGKDHGLHYPLHKGTEVLLGFENGDPDRPVIMGTVSNSQHPNMVTRENQTQTLLHTAGGNQMQFEDLAGREHIYFSTPKAKTSLHMGAGQTEGYDFKTDANWTEAEAGNKTVAVGGNNIVAVVGHGIEAIGGDKSEGVTGDKSETVCGKKKVVIGKQIDLIKDAFAMIPLSGVISGALPAGKVTDALTPSLEQTVYGTDASTVIGKSTKAVIGIKTDAFIALANAPVPGLSTGDLYVCPFGGGHTYVNGAPWVDKFIGTGHVVIGTWKTETWAGLYTLTAGAAVTVNAGAAFSATAGAAASLKAGADVAVNAGAAVNINAGAAVNVDTGGEVGIDAGGIVNVVAGEAVSIAAGAEVSVESAADITIRAAGEVQLTGTVMTFNGATVMLG